MTNNTEFFSVAKKRKVKLLSPQFIYAKLLLIYSLLYTASFALGCLLFHSLELNNGEFISDRITKYFSVSFSKCENIYDYANTLLDISSTDISHLLIVFTAGFTMLVGVITSVIFVVRGFSLGFSLSYVAYAVNSGVLNVEHPTAAVVIYSIISAALAAVLIHFGVKTACFSDEFKTLCGRPRMIIKSKALYLQLLRFLTAFGAILILNLIRCVV